MLVGAQTAGLGGSAARRDMGAVDSAGIPGQMAGNHLGSLPIPAGMQSGPDISWATTLTAQLTPSSFPALSRSGLQSQRPVGKVEDSFRPADVSGNPPGSLHLSRTRSGDHAKPTSARHSTEQPDEKAASVQSQTLFTQTSPQAVPISIPHSLQPSTPQLNQHAKASVSAEAPEASNGSPGLTVQSPFAPERLAQAPSANHQASSTPSAGPSEVTPESTLDPEENVPASRTPIAEIAPASGSPQKSSIEELATIPAPLDAAQQTSPVSKASASEAITNLPAASSPDAQRLVKSAPATTSTSIAGKIAGLEEVKLAAPLRRDNRATSIVPNETAALQHPRSVAVQEVPADLVPGGIRSNADSNSSGTSRDPGSRTAETPFAALDEAPARPVWVHATSHSAEAGYQDPALGWIAVHARSETSGLHATLLPDSPESAQALSAHLPGLVSHIRDRFTQVESVSIALSGFASSNGAETGPNSGHSDSRSAHSGMPDVALQSASLPADHRPGNEAAIGPTLQPGELLWSDRDSNGLHVSVVV